MNRNYIFPTVNDALPHLLHDLLSADEVGSRAGRTMEMTHVGITLTEPWKREILVPGRKASIAAQIAETMWVISGRDDIEWLGHYLPRAKDFSDDGVSWRAGYGKRLRSWPRRSGTETTPIDQLAYIVDLLKKDPMSRQAVMTLWDPQIDTQPGKDIPCNDWISFSNRLGKLDMHVAVRSNDAIWGWSGINTFEWSSLLEIVAGMLGVETGSLHFSVTSFHLYDHHWDKAAKIVKDSEFSCTPRAAGSPRFDAFAVNRDLETFDGLTQSWFQLEEWIRTGYDVDVTASLVDRFPEPMLQSWLRVLQWWWTGDRQALQPLSGTNLYAATYASIQPPTRPDPAAICVGLETSGSWSEAFRPTISELHDRKMAGLPLRGSDFIEFACKTHLEKHAAYGDSWKKRGEMLGILANIARKIDRLGKGETSDETSADTAMDLMVYLAKYRTWLTDVGLGSETSQLRFLWSDTPDAANKLMRKVESEFVAINIPRLQTILEQELTESFDGLEKLVVADNPSRYGTVDSMLRDAYRLARLLWDAAEKNVQSALTAAEKARETQIMSEGARIDAWKAGNATRSWNPNV